MGEPGRRRSIRRIGACGAGGSHFPTREGRNQWKHRVGHCRSLCCAKGRSRSCDQRVAETLVDTAYWGALKACRSRPRFFGSIQCSMGFEMIRGSKNSWARTRTSELATPDSEPRITWENVKT